MIGRLQERARRGGRILVIICFLLKDIVQVARGISSKEKKSTKRCTEEELLAPNSDSMQETETFFQPLEKHENISDEARKKIKKILKKNHVKSNRTSGKYQHSGHMTLR